MSDILATLLSQLPTWKDVSFAFPWVFLVLPLPLLMRRYMPIYNPPEEMVRVPFLAMMLAATGQRGFEKETPASMPVMQKVLVVICWVLLVASAAGPRELQPPKSKEIPVRDILLVIDTSGSMGTPDFALPDGELQTRMKAVKDIVSGFIQERPDDRIGLVIFGTGAFPQAPFSADHRALQMVLKGLWSGVAGEQTALGDSIGVAIRMFDKSDSKEKVVILLTDGNDTASSFPPTVATDLAVEKGIKIHTIAIGPENATGDAPELDTALLANIAQKTGGLAFVGANKQQLAEIYSEIDKVMPHMQDKFTWSTYKPLFMWPLALILLLLCSGLVLHWVGRLMEPEPGDTKPSATAGEMSQR